MDCQIFLQVHDAIGGQVPVAHYQEAMARMRKLMQVDLTNPRTGESFFIPVEIGVGPDWGHVEKWTGDLQEVAA